MCGSRGGGGRGPGVQGSRPPPLKNYKNIRFSGYTGPDPLKIRSYQASIHNWVIIGTPTKHHKWPFAGGPMMARLEWYSPHQLKKKRQIWTPSEKNFLCPRMCTISVHGVCPLGLLQNVIRLISSTV